MNVGNKTGSHNIIQPAYFSHGATQVLSSALHNWTLFTQYNKNKTFPLCG